MKIITIILASLLLIFRYCTMEPEEYEFVTIKNNSNIPLFSPKNFDVLIVPVYINTKKTIIATNNISIYIIQPPHSRYSIFLL